MSQLDDIIARLKRIEKTVGNHMSRIEKIEIDVDWIRRLLDKAWRIGAGLLAVVLLKWLTGL